MKRRMYLLSSVCALACALLPLPASAQPYPQKPVTIILPFPVATGPDVVMRLIAAKLSKWWGQPVIVDNKPGARAFIAMEAAKSAAPDGHTLVQVDPGIIALAPHLYRKIPYDPVKDFAPASPLYKANYMVTVAADSPLKSLADLVAAAKRQKDPMVYGSSGIGSPMHLGAAMVASAAGATMTHVPYKDTSQVFVDISRGEITWALGSIATTKALYQGKKLRYLAVAASERDPLFPDVPTVAEAGPFPGFDFRTWVALYAPAGTPSAIIARINADVERALAEPDVREQLPALGALAWPGSPEALATTQREASQKFSAVVKRMNLSLD
jgi:tripartite-type tricarboxylate transporter receptor subunit TctC